MTSSSEPEPSHPDESGSGHAGEHGAGDRATQALLKQLTHSDPDVRLQALRAFRSSAGAPALVEPIIAMLEDDDELVRRSAIAALGRVGDARALKPLSAISVSDEEDDRALAVQARLLVERRLTAQQAAGILPAAVPTTAADEGSAAAAAIRQATAARKRRSWKSLARRGGPAGAAARAVAVALALWAAWQLRLFVRPLYMFLVVRYPALVSIPLLSGGAALLVHLLVKVARRGARDEGDAAPLAPAAAARPRRRRLRPRRSVAHRGWRLRWHQARPLLRGPVRSALVCGTLGLLVAALLTKAWTGAAIYAHTDYGPLTPAMLSGGEVRIKPYEVAEQQAENGLNSPTERPTNLHIVKAGGRLVWTTVRDPEGVVRVFTKSTTGVMSVDASASQSHVKQSGASYDATFRYGPGMRLTDSIRWRVYKHRCYTCDIAEMTGVPTADGPIIIAPYIRYVGNWFVRRPTLGGVYVVHPDGRIDDLSPAEAARNRRVRESGRLFPEKLARRIAEAYQYKRGVWNALFTHEEQLQIADTEVNRQPFLQDFERLGSQWVTTLKPRGRTFTTAAIMTTDAVSGRTRVSLVDRGESLIGNEKALEIVRGESFPGIVFTDTGAADEAGKFRAIEPRQVFPRGQLQFLISVIPVTATRVTMSVIVDAQSQRVVATFPATPEGDADLVEYLHNGRPPAKSDGAGAPGGEPATAEDAAPSLGSEPEATLRRLLRENRAEQRNAAERVADLEAQERDLLRLLRASQELGQRVPRE